MSVVSFSASEVSEQLEGDSRLLAFYNDDTYLFFQRHSEVGHKDDDGVYVEYDNEQHCGFDVVESVSLSQQELTLKLKSALYQLPGVLVFKVDLQLSEQEVQCYGEVLKQIFAQRLTTVTITQ